MQAYLEPWREGCAESMLRRALELADVADLAFQAVTYQRVQASLEPDARQDLTGATLRIAAGWTGRPHTTGGWLIELTEAA